MKGSVEDTSKQLTQKLKGGKATLHWTKRYVVDDTIIQNHAKALQVIFDLLNQASLKLSVTFSAGRRPSTSNAAAATNDPIAMSTETTDKD